ncbi:MAG TPA: class I SAM-dependent methyltransferase [Rhizomicrobium sp.]|nr:class I SAM-dependent methyltransferase [Rhizomicrobium sp.]
MDSVYRRQRHIYDFTRRYYLFGRDRLIERIQPAPGARIVEVGCGTARNLIRLARLYPGRKLYGLDASSAMLATAQAAVERAGLKGRIVLAQGYAEALSPALFGESALFDDALFSYSLSMIPDWKQALSAAASALAPEGRVHIVDFGDLEGLPVAARKALLAWLELFHVEPRRELLQGLCGAFDKSQSIQVLPGRYAFLFSAPAASLKTITFPVARQSQPPNKTGAPAL